MYKSSKIIRQNLLVLLVISSFGIYAGLEKKSSACEEPCPNKNKPNISKNIPLKPKKTIPEVDLKPTLPGVKELKESLKFKILNEQSISGRIEKMKAITSREIQKQDISTTEFANSHLKTYKMDSSTQPNPSKVDNSKLYQDLNEKLKIKE